MERGEEKNIGWKDLTCYKIQAQAMKGVGEGLVKAEEGSGVKWVKVVGGSGLAAIIAPGK